MTTRWVTFDLDGTVIASPFDRLVLPLVDAHFAPAVGLGRARALLAERQRALQLTNRVAVFDWDELVRWLARETAMPWQADLAEVARAALAGLTPSQRRRYVYADAEPALHSLAAAGWRLAALTNGYLRYQVPLLRGLGLLGLFDAVIGPDVAGCAKPDPTIFAALPAGSAVAAHVGDLLSQDVHLARQAGVTAVWLNRRRRAADPSHRSLQRRLDLERQEIPMDLAPEDVRPDAVISRLTEVAALVGAA